MHDIAIIGGGINGCGIARDAAGRGYSVLLAEMGDLASGTSSWSTKLIHGGLRYLEHFEFRLVREALKEREVLWSLAPHIIQPMRFVLPHHAGLRPAWQLRLGLFLYDHLGGRQRLPGTRVLRLAEDPAGTVLKPEFTTGFEFSDCRVDDARLVVLNARDAAQRGAKILPRTRVTGARREGGVWRISLREEKSGRTRSARARILINAAGPWAGRLLAEMLPAAGRPRLRLVKGSHIVVPKLYEHDRGYVLQNSDGRVIFLIPFERDFTLIGTTDEDYDGDPGDARICAQEIDYLCAAANAYLRTPLSPEQIVWRFSGVRPLVDDGATRAQEATRDYVLHCEREAGEASLISVFGGKLTTYRRLAEAVLDKVAFHAGEREGPWTASKPLPGGDFTPGEIITEIEKLLAAHGY
ncbi:MAG: glycerol-3-phosphate dehydrogenase, partial [Alphaproteobacteria bacterium]